MNYVTLWLTLVSAATSAAAAKAKRADTSFGLYAYGSSSGGLSLQYSNGSIYIISGDQATSGYGVVNFSTNSTSPRDTGTLSIAAVSGSNDTSAVGELVAITQGINAAVEVVNNASSSQVDDEWSFFGSILTYGGTTSNFYAVPIDDAASVFQIYWMADTSSATNGSKPVTIKKTPPPALASPGSS
ncbi:uncharacterized protein PV09_06487 [Verruconis gallopava]|uniref:DOMON domain-containing protein n=1 Tax=Verruconis gallopava TaxID=253628 RepID=A0A0D1XJ75_9PEZI|nr:uncharacterized protein PV09_06487 [Verruconis gallopava]KIW02346.1 hypothetical protein PV09_06487 [Verruconis gallopava]